MSPNQLPGISERNLFAWLRQQVVPAALISMHVCLLAYSGYVHNPTENEAQHLVAGLHHWHTGTFSLYRVNPPLIKTIAAIPVALAGYNADWSGYYERVGGRPVFQMGEDFIRANGRRSIWMMTMARWMCIPFSVLGAWVCYLWARDLFGIPSGWLVCCLWCFSPMVLGNASLITPDAHAASLGLAACYTFWRWLKQPTWAQAVVTGAVLGLAELSKTTLVLFYPLWPVIWVIYRWPDRAAMTRKQWGREAGMLALRMAIGIYILNLGYLFEGSFTKLRDFEFVSKMLKDNASVSGNRFRDTWLGEAYVPFPSNYVIGIDIQQRDFEDFSRPSYLRGRYQPKGWWYYYLYAILVKAPIGTLGLIGLTLFLRRWPDHLNCRSRDIGVLLAPAAVIFFVVSLKSGFSHHSRYILPCVPFVFIWISRVASVSIDGLSGMKRFARPMLAMTAAALVSWSAGSSLYFYPHSLSYFNELAGGPEAGPKHLISSNVDWGQDLLLLENWTTNVAVDVPVYLAFFNYYNPFDLGLSGVRQWPFEAGKTDSRPEIPEGYYAISINLLYEYPWDVRAVDGHRYRIDHLPLGYLRTAEPVGRAGYSIRIFSAEQLRAAYAAPESRLLTDL